MIRAIIDVRDLSAEDVQKVEQYVHLLREKARLIELTKEKSVSRVVMEDQNADAR